MNREERRDLAKEIIGERGRRRAVAEADHKESIRSVVQTFRELNYAGDNFLARKPIDATIILEEKRGIHFKVRIDLTDDRNPKLSMETFFDNNSISGVLMKASSVKLTEDDYFDIFLQAFQKEYEREAEILEEETKKNRGFERAVNEIIHWSDL